LSDFGGGGNYWGESMKNDAALLKEYATGNSEEAFRELVARHAPMVHSAALRQVGCNALAEDVTQVVFSLLARQADKLTDRPVIAGWLHRTARFAALKAVRTERRRRDREQEAHPMNEEDDSQAIWRQIEPHLDEAIDTLGENDRNAVMLRYFDGRNLRDIGDALGVSEDAAQKRVSRALEKLRAFLACRKVAVSVGVIAALLPSNAVAAAPAGLIRSVSSTVIAGTASTATLNLLNETMNLIFWTKVKTAVPAIVAGAVVVGTPIAVQQNSIWQLQAENAAIRQELVAKPTTVTAAPVVTEDQIAQLRREAAEVHELRAEIGQLRELDRSRMAELQKLESANTELQRRFKAGESKLANAQDIIDRNKDDEFKARRINQMKRIGLAFSMAQQEGVIPKTVGDLVKLVGWDEQTQNDLSARLIMFDHGQPNTWGEDWASRILVAERAPTQTTSGEPCWLLTLLDASVIVSKQPPPADGIFRRQ
jgi:RNA polymerase sigma factor (sigma-70 family)